MSTIACREMGKVETSHNEKTAVRSGGMPSSVRGSSSRGRAGAAASLGSPRVSPDDRVAMAAARLVRRRPVRRTGRELPEQLAGWRAGWIDGEGGGLELLAGEVRAVHK